MADLVFDKGNLKNNNENIIPDTTAEAKKSKKIKTVYIVVGLIALLSLVGVSIKRYYFGTQPLNNNSLNVLEQISGKNNPTPVPQQTNPLDGTSVDKAKAERYPLAVVIENHPDARPQYGLTKAAIVYEAITEGGITRFLAILGPYDATRIGPIRSARTFFVDWASEFRAYFAHAGGNQDALALIPTSPLYNEDLLGAADYGKRIPHNNVATEHTLYSDTDSLYKLASDRKYPANAVVNQFNFKDDATANLRGTTQTIAINFSTSSYLVNWSYDKESNAYTRSLDNSPHIDALSNTQIKAKVIAVQTVSRTPITTPDGESSFQFSDTGSGKATIYQDGKATETTWKKASQKDRTHFYDSTGAEISFNRGQMWIEVIPPGTDVSAQSS